jgi:Transposase DDE domain
MPPVIPVHDQSITAPSKNHRRSINTQSIICSQRRPVVLAGQCRPGNRNDVVVARHTVTRLLDGRVVLGDGGYRAITSITTPRPDQTGRTIRDDHHRAHRRIPARIEHVIAQLKDRQIPRQRRRRGQAINHTPQIVASP